MSAPKTRDLSHHQTDLVPARKKRIKSGSLGKVRSSDEKKRPKDDMLSALADNFSEVAPTPTPSRDRGRDQSGLGRKRAENKLQERARLQQAQVQFEQWLQTQPLDPRAVHTQRGVQLQMLNHLIRYQECCYRQHSGDQVNPLPTTRDILKTLVQLRGSILAADGNRQAQSSTPATYANSGELARRRGRAEKTMEIFSDKPRVGGLLKVVG